MWGKVNLVELVLKHDADATVIDMDTLETTAAPPIVQAIKTCLNEPKKLAECCRKTVRRNLTKFAGIENLPIPNDIKNYLKYIDIEQ